MSRDVAKANPKSFAATPSGIMRSSRNSRTLVAIEADNSGSPSTPRITNARRHPRIRNTSAVFSKCGGCVNPTTCTARPSGVQKPGDRMEHVSHSELLTHFQKSIERRMVEPDIQVGKALPVQLHPRPALGSASTGMPKAFSTPALPGRPGIPS